MTTPINNTPVPTSLFSEDFITWADRHASARSNFVPRPPSIDHDLTATMPTAVIEVECFERTWRITVDATAKISPIIEGCERDMIFIERTFTVERQLKSGGWGFAQTWTHHSSAFIVDLVSTLLVGWGHSTRRGGPSTWCRLDWGHLDLLTANNMQGYFDALWDHGHSDTARYAAYAVKRSLLDWSLNDDARVEWQRTDAPEPTPTPEKPTLTPEAVASVMEACIAVEEGFDGFSPAAQRDLRLAFQESQARGENQLEKLKGVRHFYADVLGLLGYDLIDLSFEERARGIGTALCDAALLLVGDGYRLAAPEPTPEEPVETIAVPPSYVRAVIENAARPVSRATTPEPTEDTTPALTSQDCPRCDGGTDSPDAYMCLDCNGVGRVLAPNPAGSRLTPSHVREMTEATGLTLHTEPDTLKPCGNCGGHGLDCTVCHGDGVIYPY